MTSSNMDVVAVERRTEPAFLHSIVTYILCQVFEEYAKHVGGEAGARMLSLTETGHLENAQGTSTPHILQTVVARKSS